MRRWFHGGTARYAELAKTHAQHVMEAIAHNLYCAPGLIVPTPKKTREKREARG